MGRTVLQRAEPQGQPRKGRNNEMEAYCLKCRTKREMQGAQQVTMKNGKPATRGKCPVCGTQMYRIGKG
jgi:Zn finger protein HypA/HybF involved in hydrogenase expression